MRDIFELLYLYYAGEVISKKEMADSMFVSEKKIDELIKESIDLELINESDKSISEKGREFLELYRVDNAIIMAAGFGSRFVPMTYQTPKGLLEVHGEVMIERQIKQLQEKGITDITIVVGYLKEKFSYLANKYNVKLIFNPDYSTKNNISSLYYASQEMRNTYILTSDIYMPKNIYREFEYCSFYASEYFEDCTEEWAIKYNSDNLITEVNPEGGCDTWAMYGPVFFRRNFSEKITELIREIYNCESSSQWYWEDVYMRNIPELDLYIRKYPNKSILEFESLEELRDFDDSYLYNSRCDILEVIKRVFEVELFEISGFQTLKEGMTNDSFLFEVRGNKYVFRNPGIGTELLINREQEAHVYDLIKPLEIADEVVYLQPDKGYKITRYIPGSRHINPNNIEEVKLALTKLRKLHKAKLVANHEFNIEERIEFYLKLCKNAGAFLFDDIDQVYSDIKIVIENLKLITRPKILCHIDSVWVNFLISENEITLLDWEYSGMADPLIDISMFVVYGGLQGQEIIDLLNLYLERNHTKEELYVVHSYIALAGFLWSLWTLYKQASGEDFGTYAEEQYEYAKTYSELINSVNLSK